MNFFKVTDLVWCDPDCAAFNCVVDFEGIGEVPFTCFKDDPYEHAKLIWSRALAGEFGDIAPFTPYVPDGESLELMTSGIPKAIL